MPKIKAIFLANLAEVALPLVRLMKKARGKEEILEDHLLCDRFVFSGGKNQILVTPFLVNREFLKDSAPGLINWAPKKISESLCQAILTDKTLLGKVVEVIRKNPGIEIASYAATPEFYELTGYLAKRGLKFKIPEAPDKEDYWVQNFFDSKAGFRQVLATKLPSFPAMPEGAICGDTDEVKGWGKTLIKKYGGCVLKTNWGLAGAGLKIVRRGDDLEKILAAESYWKDFPIVVERFVTPAITVCGGAPNIELRIRHGKLEPLYVCSMRVSADGVFQGVEMGKGAVPERITKLLTTTGKRFGNLLKRYGYQGYFETDWVYGKDNVSYPIEANLRQTGGTHVFKLCRQLLGPAVFKNYYVVADNFHPVKNSNYQRAKKQVTDLLFPIRGQKEGVVLTIVGCLPKGRIGYVVIAGGQKRTKEIEKKLLKRLG